MESLNIEKLEATTKLFNLIRKKIDLVEIKRQKIKKLLSRTPAPDINASDGNYNDSTPLHMAIRRNELEIVELLVSHDADLMIQNRDKLTPLELAEKLNCSQSIIAALKPKELIPSSPIVSNLVLEFSETNKEQTRQTINKKYVREFDLGNDDRWSKIKARRRDGSFKILTINNATVNDALDFILSEKFIKTFNESTHLFFVDIRIDTTKICINNEELERLQKMLDAHKQLVIQWTSLNSSECCILYKEPYGSVAFLQEQNWEDQPMTTEEQQVQLANELDENCQFPMLLKMLHHGLGGSFRGNLMETELDVSEEIESWKLIDYAAKSDDALSLRYLQLFNWPLHKKNTNGSRTMEIACEHASPKSISAILDLPDTNVPHELLPICWQRNVLKLKNLEGLTPVLIATKCGKTETLDYLINCGVKEDCIEAMDLAWGQSYDKVVALLDAETPFPDNVDPDVVEDDALRKLIKSREDFHEAIREDSTDFLKGFIKEYPQLKQVLNIANQSALRTARAEKQWDTYLYLQSEGFRYGSDEDPNLTQEEKENLKQLKPNYFRKLKNSWITFLLSRSKLGHDGHDRNYFGEIRELYEQLDEIPYACTVLRVLEMSSIQQIVFDFHKESAVDLDPTLTETTAGSCDYVTGNLYIGAKQPLGALLGTLAHELTHFAMQTVFNNDCNPYMASDIENKNDFQKIVEWYCERKEIDSIIEKVYNYKRHEWPSELIVRVPHIIAHYYKPDDEKQGSQLKDKAPDLFNFYDKEIEKPFRQFIANPAHFKNQHLNDLLRQIGTSSHPNIRFKSDTIFSENDINQGDGGLVLAGSLPQLVKIDLLQALKKKQALSAIKSCYIFTSIDQFENQDIVLKIRNSFKSNIRQTLVVDCSSVTEITGVNKQMLWNTVGNFDKQKRLILIAHAQIADLLLKDAGKIVQTRLLQREYSWSHLDAETQSRLLKTRIVDFQGYPVALDKLISTDSEYAKQIPLSYLIEDSPITIGKPLPISYGYDEDYYIERTFKVATDEEDLIFPPNKVTDLLRRIQQEKVLLISDRAGMGKTTILTHFSRKIKETDPSCWVMRFNLNDCTDVLEEEKQKRTIEKRATTEAIEFLRQKLLKLESTMEKPLFSEMLEKKKIVLMFDAFDEISPFYNNILLNLFADLRKSPIEQLWITTRPFLSKNLVNKLQPISCALQPFTSDNQLDFLVRFWRKSIEVVSDETKVKKFAENLIKRLSKSIDDNSRKLASVPLQARMLAEAFDQDLVDFYHSEKPKPELPRKLDLLDVYKRFSHRKYSVYIFEKNSLLKVNVARENLAAILSGGVNLRKIHQQLALQELFPREKDHLLEFYKKRSLRSEELNRIGIVQYEGTKFSFVHRTFAEYYASDFFVSTLVKPRPQTNLDDPFLDIILYLEIHGVIRKFINSFLATGEFRIPEENIKFYGDKINRLWKKSWLIEPERPNILHTAIVEDNFHIVKFVVTCLVATGHLNALRNLYVARNQQGKSIWLTVTEENQVDVLELLWSTWKQINVKDNRKSLKSVLMMQDSRQRTAWTLAVALNKVEIFEKFTEYAKEAKLTPEELITLVLFEDSNAYQIWFSAGYRGQTWFFNKLFLLAKEIGFQVSHFKKLVLATTDFKESVWQWTASGGSVEVYCALRKWAAAAELELAGTKQILCGKNERGYTVWHQATYSPSAQKDMQKWRKQIKLDMIESDDGKSTLLPMFWKWAKESGLTADEIKNELLAENNKGETIWHLAIKYRDQVVSNELVHLIKEDPEINTKEFFTELLSKTYKGGTLLWNAIKSRLNLILKMVLEWFQEAELSPAQIKRMILEKDEGKNTFHFIIASYDEEMLETFWTFAKESKLTDEDLKRLLFEKDNCEMSVWNSLIKSDDLRMFDKLLKLSTKKFSPSPQEFADLLLEKRRLGCTWHNLFQYGRHRLLVRLLQVINDQDLCRELILSKNEVDQNVFHLAAQSKNSNVFDSLLKWLEKAQMTRDELKSILSSRDCWDKTALVWAVKEKRMETATTLLELGADVGDLDEKQCNSLKSFMQNRGSDNPNLSLNIEKRLEELSKIPVQVDQPNSAINEEEFNIFDQLDAYTFDYKINS